LENTIQKKASCKKSIVVESTSDFRTPVQFNQTNYKKYIEKIRLKDTLRHTYTDNIVNMGVFTSEEATLRIGKLLGSCWYCGFCFGRHMGL